MSPLSAGGAMKMQSRVWSSHDAGGGGAGASVPLHGFALIKEHSH